LEDSNNIGSLNKDIIDRLILKKDPIILNKIDIPKDINNFNNQNKFSLNICQLNILD